MLREMPRRREKIRFERLKQSLIEEIAGNLERRITRKAKETAQTSLLAQQERHKAEVEFIKLTTTLSTGAILLIVTFLEKLFQKPMWKPLVVISLLLFLLSVLLCIGYFTLLIPNFGKKGEEIGDTQTAIMSGVMLWALLLLLAGLTLMAIFAAANLLAGETAKSIFKISDILR